SASRVKCTPQGMALSHIAFYGVIEDRKTFDLEVPPRCYHCARAKVAQGPKETQAFTEPGSMADTGGTGGRTDELRSSRKALTVFPTHPIESPRLTVGSDAVSQGNTR